MTNYWGLLGYSNTACFQGFTNGTIGRPISFKVLPTVPMVNFSMVPLGEPKTEPLLICILVGEYYKVPHKRLFNI